MVCYASSLTVNQVTIWFPLRLRRIIDDSVPKVDRYTELGKLRTRSDIDREYQRLLDRDHNPLSFLYSGELHSYQDDNFTRQVLVF